MTKIILHSLHIICTFIYILNDALDVHAHGRMENPPARNSAWRHGFNTPHNYNDVELNCGGGHQKLLNFGLTCGVCGDSISAKPRLHEYGGKYATGRIVRKYEMGEIIDVEILLTANHLGWMEFRLCPIEHPQVEATHECLNKNVLNIIGFGTQFKVKENAREIKLKVKLPNTTSCSHCVLQWRYRGGNNWGSEDGKSGLGYGPQEEFINCADISIINNSKIKSTTRLQNILNSTDIINSTLNNNTLAQIETTTKTYRSLENIICIVENQWKYFHGMMEFCIKICSDSTRECPSKFCKCHGINAWLR